MYDIIILGSGPAGLTAGIYAIRAGRKTLIIAGTRWGGQLMLTTLVENFPGFPDGIQGPQLMVNIRKQAERLGVEFMNSDFTQEDFSFHPFKITADGKVYEAKAVIIATGADSIWLNVPGELQLRGKGVSTCAVCDAFFFKNKDVLVIGGGDSAMEEALVLAKVAKSVTIIHRRDKFRASDVMQKRVFAEPKIRIIWNTEVKEILGEERVTGVVLNSKPQLKITSPSPSPTRRGNEGVRSDGNIMVSIDELNDKIMKQFDGGKIIEQKEDEINWELPIDGVFIAIGHKPNTDKFKGIELDAKGYVVRKEVMDESGLLKYRSATSVPGVFVAGDVHDYRYKQVVTAAGFGCIAALDADRWLQENQDK